MLLYSSQCASPQTADADKLESAPSWERLSRASICAEHICLPFRYLSTGRPPRWQTWAKPCRGGLCIGVIVPVTDNRMVCRCSSAPTWAQCGLQESRCSVLTRVRALGTGAAGAAGARAAAGPREVGVPQEAGAGPPGSCCLSQQNPSHCCRGGSHQSSNQRVDSQHSRARQHTGKSDTGQTQYATLSAGCGFSRPACATRCSPADGCKHNSR